MKTRVLLFAFVILLASCSGLKGSRSFTPEIAGIEAVEITCTIHGAIGVAVCRIALTDETKDFVKTVEAICTLIGTDRCDVFQDDDATTDQED